MFHSITDAGKAQDLKTIYLLKIHNLKHLICNTEKGALELNIRKDENEYFFTLDSVPLDKSTNNELLKLYGI